MKSLCIWTLACLAILLGLTGCFPPREWSANGSPLKKPVDGQNLPLFPNAQEVKIASISTGRPTRMTNFWTKDKPEEVLAFYEHVLVLDDWELSRDIKSDTERYFSWSNGTNNQAYTLHIHAVPNSAGRTDVEVRLIIENPE